MAEFSEAFRAELHDLMRWRRDVRRFRPDAVPDAELNACLEAFALAPSVGLSEPWRVMRVDGEAARAAVRENFRAANAEALGGYTGDKAKTYASLKLSGMDQAPVQLAVWCDDGTAKGAGLGARSMPEMRRYSVVSAVMNFWLAARARGLGVGWVSILDPELLARDLRAPDGWSLIAYLCIGYPEEDHLDPELERAGWERREASVPLEVR